MRYILQGVTVARDDGQFEAETSEEFCTSLLIRVGVSRQ
jgi:hypothetical protein